MRMKMKYKVLIKDYFFILIGSVIYALSTVLFVFPAGLIFGGTSGISVILAHFLPFSPGVIISVINIGLIVLAFFMLGHDMATKSFVGSLCTTLFITLFEYLIPLDGAPLQAPYLSMLAGAGAIAVASAVMFLVNSSSGGTDIIALIVKKFSGIRIGRALLISDVVIVLFGGFLSGLTVFICSVIGLFVKTMGIDLVIWIIKKAAHRSVLF